VPVEIKMKAVNRSVTINNPAQNNLFTWTEKEEEEK
jgi:hypothetical protein